MAVKGLHRVSGRSSNYKGSENIISKPALAAAGMRMTTSFRTAVSSPWPTASA